MFYTLHFLSIINKFFYSFIFIRFPARHLINFPAKPVKSGTQSLINILFERQPREERNHLFCAWPRRIINYNFGVFKIYINTPKAGLGWAGQWSVQARGALCVPHDAQLRGEKSSLQFWEHENWKWYNEKLVVALSLSLFHTLTKYRTMWTISCRPCALHMQMMLYYVVRGMYLTDTFVPCHVSAAPWPHSCWPHWLAANKKAKGRQARTRTLHTTHTHTHTLPAPLLYGMSLAGKWQ